MFDWPEKMHVLRSFLFVLATTQPRQPKPNLLYMGKEVSEGDKRFNAQLFLSNSSTEKKTEKLFEHEGLFGEQGCDLTLEKANFLENLLTYVNQASISPVKNNETAIYVVNIALAQLLLLVNSLPDIDNYVYKDNELKMLCPMYNTETGQFLGTENRLAAISVRGDKDELFLSYGFNKEKSKQLFSVYKVRLPNVFMSSAFKKHKEFLISDEKRKKLNFIFLLAFDNRS